MTWGRSILIWGWLHPSPKAETTEVGIVGDKVFMHATHCNLKHPSPRFRPLGQNPVQISQRSSAHNNWHGGATRHWEQFCDRFSRFDTIPACDTDTRTHTGPYNAINNPMPPATPLAVKNKCDCCVCCTAHMYIVFHFLSLPWRKQWQWIFEPSHAARSYGAISHQHSLHRNVMLKKVKEQLFSLHQHLHNPRR